MVQEFSSTISFDTSTAVANLQKLSTQVNSYSSSLSRNAAATRGFNAQQLAVDQSLKGGVAVINKTTKSVNKLANQNKKAAATANRLELSWRSVLRVFAIQVVGRAVTGLTSELTQSVGKARELQIALAEIQTISPELRGLDLSAVQEFTEAISTDFGIEQIEVAAGLYQSLSNQVGNTVETLRFLNDAAEFSVATNTSLSASVDLLSGALNALDLSASQTRRIMDVLFKTIELGRVRGEELANAFGKILPIANELGVSLEELAATVATITIQGVKFDKASVLLTRVMTGLLKPTKALKTTFDDLGISSVRAGVQAFGLTGFLKLLLKQTDGTIEGTSEFFNELRELQGVLLVTAEDGQKVADTFEKIKNEARGATRAAAELILESPAKQLEKSITEFQNVILSDFGTPAIDVLNKIIKGLGGAENAVKVFFAVVAGGALVIVPILTGQILGAIGGIAAALVNATAKAIGFNLALTTGPALLIAANIAVWTTTFILLNELLNETPDRVKEVTDRFEALGKVGIEVRAIVLENQQKINEALKETANEQVATVAKGLFELQKLYLKDRDAAIAAQQQATDNLNDQVNQRVSIVDKGLKQVINAEKKAADTIKKSAEDLADFQFRINQGRFDRNIQALQGDPRRQAKALKKRVEELLKVAAGEAAGGDAEQAEFFNEQALRRATQLANLTGQRRVGEKAINAVLKNRGQIESQIVKQAEAQAKAAKAIKIPLAEQIALLKKNLAIRDTLQKRLTSGIAGKKLTKEEVDNLQSRLDDANDLVEKGFKDVAITFDTTKGVVSQEDIEGLTKSFESALTGKPITLKIAAQEAVDRTIQILSKIPDTIPIEVKLQLKGLTGQEVGIQGFGAIQDKLAEAAQEFAKGTDNSAAFADAQLKVSESLNQTRLTFDGITKAARDAAVQALKTAGPFKAIAEQKLKGFLAQFAELKTAVEQAIQQGDIDKIDELQKKLGELQKAASKGKTIKGIPGIDQEQLSKLLATLSIKLGEAQTNIENLQKASEEQAGVKELGNTIENLSNVVNALGLGPKFDPLGKSAINQIPKVQSLIDVLKKLNALPTQAPTQAQARGGPVRFFNEGGQVRGTDTVPAMLTPGEFVVNASSSRRFFSELVAINSGKAPVFRQEGGPVENNTFTGDINVNMPEGASADGRAVAKQIRRELRRNTSRLRN